MRHESGVGDAFLEATSDYRDGVPRLELIVWEVHEPGPLAAPLQGGRQTDLGRLPIERRLRPIEPAFKDPDVPRQPEIVIALAAPRLGDLRWWVPETSFVVQG